MLKTRLAPTPSGFLHLGNAFSFLLTWLIARKRAGKIHLRIDDIDSERVRSEYVQDVFDSLAWLGLDFDSEARSQASRQAIYRAYLRHLQASLYPCACSRKAIQQNSRGGLYGQTCLPAPFAPCLLDAPITQNLRLHIPDEAEITLRDCLRPTRLRPAEIAGDLVIWRKTDAPAYQLASVVDDLEADINFIVRGEDLWNSTAFQVFLAEKLGEERFSKITFLHHGLVRDESGGKLSKSEGAEALRTLRLQGVSPAFVYARFADFWGISLPTAPTLQDLLEAFAPPVFNLT